MTGSVANEMSYRVCVQLLLRQVSAEPLGGNKALDHGDNGQRKHEERTSHRVEECQGDKGCLRVQNVPGINENVCGKGS